jgi:hypothetical protein
MIESLKTASAVRNNSPAHNGEAAPQHPSDPHGEAAGLSTAIQRLIAERDNYKGQAGAQEREMIRLRAINEELRRQNEHATLVRDHYIRLSTELLTQMKHVDLTLKEVVKKTYGVAAGFEDRDATLISLARRLSPNKGPDKAPADDAVLSLR